METILKFLSNASLVFAVAAVIFLLLSLLGKSTGQHFPFELGSKERKWAAAIGVVLCLAACLPQVSFPHSDSDATPVGSIVASYLPPNMFCGSGPKPNWMLANGDEIPKDAKLYTVVKTSPDLFASSDKTPDLRGVFLRGVNANRSDGKQDPDTRNPGSYQPDEFKKHDHGGGAHTHEASMDREWSVRDGVACVTSIGKALLTQQPASVSPPTSEMPAGAIIKPDGGSETRPRNVAVYYYIKIN